MWRLNLAFAGDAAYTAGRNVGWWLQIATALVGWVLRACRCCGWMRGNQVADNSLLKFFHSDATSMKSKLRDLGMTKNGET